ncbi:hypothetical protein [Actinomadura formosensis]|uniref:hypothetical protein n=1 Tax=Actinomadura formosensis TaxID=60706 RepID=UPI000836522B|nr:hypothetical protein [Actinomadura formosensis]
MSDDAGSVWDRAIAAEAGPEPAAGPAAPPDAPPDAEPDAVRHLCEAGRSLLAAARDAAAALDRTRPLPGRENPPAEASKRPRAGTSDRSGRAEPGEPWAAATGGPIDIG